MAVQTLNTLGERVLRLLKRGDIPTDVEWDIREIKQAVKDSAHTIVEPLLKPVVIKNFLEKPTRIDGRYVNPYSKITVLIDADTEENYVDIPASYIDIGGGMGIQSVRPILKQVIHRAMIPISNRELDIYLGLPAGMLEGQWAFMIRGNKVFFTKRYDKTLIEAGLKRVNMDIVTLSPQNADDDDPFPVSDSLIKLIIEDVLILYGASAEQIKDLINDENPNLTKVNVNA